MTSSAIEVRYVKISCKISRDEKFKVFVVIVF